MDKEENVSESNYLEKVESINQAAKIQEEIVSQEEAYRIVTELIDENERFLAQINNLSKYRKNKNIISPQLSLLTNKLQRNLIRVARLVPPEALADPSHVHHEKQRFLKFYRGRNAPKKNGSSQPTTITAGSTPSKVVKQGGKAN